MSKNIYTRLHPVIYTDNQPEKNCTIQQETPEKYRVTIRLDFGLILSPQNNAGQHSTNLNAHKRTLFNGRKPYRHARRDTRFLVLFNRFASWETHKNLCAFTATFWTDSSAIGFKNSKAWFSVLTERIYKKARKDTKSTLTWHMQLKSVGRWRR